MTETLTTFHDHHGQPAIQIQSPDGAQATVLLHGAHVVSWVPAGGTEQLYLSPQADYSAGKAIRGGIPVIFPQFEQKGPDRSLPRHGFVRNRAWQLESQRQGKDHAQATFQLADSDETRALWPHGFELELTVSVSGAQLELELYVRNSGSTVWPFSAALHTYLGVAELSRVRLHGLEGHLYIDNLLNGEAVEDHPEKSFSGEFDRIYEKASSLLLTEGKRRLQIQSDNLPDAVVWNPGPDKCAALSDMPADDWQHMLCVEAARILQPKTLAPGEEWTGRQCLTLLA
ncbi:MAG: D-hexose-6-phosphate mutarotase [Aquabacterium sp.]|uniref:D-hexose-6-phosphate mutarotase n=1 Tax=Aquabacterium sp. TaxID=1872578 RepID=UPI002716B47B|nr:D-hexose-6-phosphate mutarotase [Aquabacterium sp.]MDO9001904.1 D-hexose-6-phosphate mutarotase [Aquabacterium sp.]